MPEERIFLEMEAARIRELLAEARHAHIPLSVASAMAFHLAYKSTRAILDRRDYDDALCITAAALSRLIPIYTLRDPREGRTEVKVDLASQSFVRGATQLRANNGELVEELTVARGDLEAAISLVKKAGLPFSLAISPGEEPATARTRQARKEDEKKPT